MIRSRPQQHRLINSVVTAAVFFGAASLWAQVQPATPSFSSTSEVNLLNPALTQFGTFRQGNPGTTLNFNVYNLPASTGTTSAMSLVHYPPVSIGDSAAIALQTANVSGLQPVGGSGTPNAPMQLVVSTSQVGNFQVSYQLEFSSDSLPTALHKSIAIAAYATVLRHGDYNADGKVDAGDYVIWRKTNGQSVTPFTRADDNGDGQVGIADYNAWRAAFTGTFGSGSADLSGPLTVPEPGAIMLGLLGISFAALTRLRKRARA
jgi:hypothetical protein